MKLLNYDKFEKEINMSKGGTFERDVSRALSLWWTNGDRDDVIWRTKNSGGVATARRKTSKSVRLEEFGDLKSDDPIAIPLFEFFSIELKTGYGKKTKSKIQDNIAVHRINNWAVMDILDSNIKASQFFIFWEQAEHDARESKREPLLIFRRNRKQPCIAMYSDIFQAYGKNVPFNTIEIREVKHHEITICNLSKFLSWTQGVISQEFIISNLKPVLKQRRIKNERRKVLSCK